MFFSLLPQIPFDLSSVIRLSTGKILPSKGAKYHSPREEFLVFAGHTETLESKNIAASAKEITALAATIFLGIAHCFFNGRDPLQPNSCFLILALSK
jgi:hypothetical protein